MNKKIFVAGFMALVLLSIPLTLYVNQKRQLTESKASSSTTLSLTPGSTSTNPITANIGDPVVIDIMVDPGDSLVSFVKFQVRFDKNKLKLADVNGFVPNTAAFPTTIEGPITTDDSLAAAVSIGGDPNKAIRTVTKLGTLNLKATGSTGTTPTQVVFTTLSEVLSDGSTNQAAENVLSTTNPANVVIHQAASVSATVMPTISTTPSPIPTQTSTTLEFDIQLHGIGSSGDNPNPQGASLSNKNPLHPQRNLSIIIYDSNNEQVSSLTSALIYNSTQGNFTDTVDLGTNFPAGNYSIKIQTDRYLWKLVPGIAAIKPLSKNKVNKTALVAGDIKKDNLLNILDYNVLLDCGYGAIDPLPLADPNSLYNTDYCKNHNEFRPSSDIDDNGIVNSADYNLFLREISVQNGD